MIKSYEFTHKNVPALKKDVFMRMLFAILFLITFVWQFVLLVIRYNAQDVTKFMMGLAILTMILSLFMGIIAVMYAYGSHKTMRLIHKKGYIVKRVNLLANNTKKSSFINMYSVLNKVLTILMLMLLASGLTYGILDLIFNSTQPFYLPLLFMVTISGFNSVWHLKTEIITINEVREYNSIY